MRFVSAFFSPLVALTFGSSVCLADMASSLKIEAEYPSGECSAENPMLIEIRNTSFFTDATDIKFIAFSTFPNRSRAECAESFSLKDLVIKSRETYRSCWSTLKERGLYYQGKRLPFEMMDDTFSLSAFGFRKKYGDSYGDTINVRGFLATAYREHLASTNEVSPKQHWGCYDVPVGVDWHGKAQSAEKHAGF